MHRTAIVNLDDVDQVEPLGNGTCLLRLSDGSQLTVSRSRQQQIVEALPTRLARLRDKLFRNAESYGHLGSKPS